MTYLLLDTDIGTDVDDALALAYLIGSPELDLIGVTTVHGNAPLRAQIARALLDAGGREDVPVVAGRSRPLRGSSVAGFHWNELWGHEGLGLIAPEDLLGEDLSPERDDAARFIIDQARLHPGELRVIAVGPVTNLARALQLEPALADLLESVVIMGGIVEREKVAWAAHFETNLNADPGAAEIVLESAIRTTLVPLEVTLQVFLEPAHLDRLRSSGKQVAASLLRLIAEMREPFLAFNERNGLDGSDFDERTYMHDPLAVYVATQTSHVSVRETLIAVGWEGDAIRTLEVESGGRAMGVCSDVETGVFVEHWMRAVLSAR